MINESTNGKAGGCTSPVEYVEDGLAAKTGDEVVLLTDEQLAGGGLVPMRGYMRTRRSTNALRKERHRKQLASRKQPRRQLNVVAPAAEDARVALRDLAAALASGAVTPAAVLALMKAGGPATVPADKSADQRDPKAPPERPAVVKDDTAVTPQERPVQPAAPDARQSEALVVSPTKPQAHDKPSPTSKAEADPFAEELDRVRRVLECGGWRARIIRRLARGGCRGAVTPLGWG